MMLQFGADPTQLGVEPTADNTHSGNMVEWALSAAVSVSGSPNPNYYRSFVTKIT